MAEHEAPQGMRRAMYTSALTHELHTHPSKLCCFIGEHRAAAQESTSHSRYSAKGEAAVLVWTVHPSTRIA